MWASRTMEYYSALERKDCLARYSMDEPAGVMCLIRRGAEARTCGRAHTFNSIAPEAEAGSSLQVQGHPGLQGTARAIQTHSISKTKTAPPAKREVEKEVVNMLF